MPPSRSGAVGSRHEEHHTARVVLTARVMVGGGGGAGKDRRLGLLTSICAHISAAYAELVLLRWGTSATSTEPSLHIPL